MQQKVNKTGYEQTVSAVSQSVQWTRVDFLQSEMKNKTTLK